MEITDSLANPALKTIYNGKSLRENYSDLNLNDVVYEGMIGALLGNIGGAVNIAQAGRSNTQNYQQGNSRGFSGQMRNTNPADVLRNADLNSLYTAAGSNAQRSMPYAAAHATSVQQQRSTPYTANNGTAGRSQTVSYADVFRQMQAEQERATESEYARYKELDRKFLDGSISEEEFEELRRLDNTWREVDAPGKSTGTDSDSEYARYKELKQRFRNSDIDEQEWNELLRLENVWGQVGELSKLMETDDTVPPQKFGEQNRLLEKTTSGGIMKNIKSGALNPESEDASSHAERYYNFVRKMTTDVQKISENTGFSVSDIQNIKDFVFYEEHELDGGVIQRFDPSYEMAESWQRLVEGKRIMPHDITLLHHELLEHSLMMRGMSQDEAHIIATRKYNYGREARMYYDQIKKHKK